MADAAPVAISFFDKDFNCIDCNHPAVEMFSFESKDEFIKLFRRTMPTFQPNGMSSRRHFNGLLSQATEQGRVKSEILCRRIDGILIPTEVVLVCVEHENNNMVIGYFTNLTGIQAKMKEAANSAEMTQMYLASSPLAMEVFDGHYRITDCNKQAMDLLGYTEKNEYKKRNTYLAPEHIYHDIYTRIQDSHYYQRAMKEGYVRYEWVFQRENGEKLPCEITRVRISRPDGEFVVSYIHDLSTIRQMAEELKKAEATEKESRAKSQFLSQMSHVLRTPMNAISGLADIQLQKNNTPEAEETLQQIQRFTRMQLGIISDILDLSNVDAGNMQLLIKHIDIPSLIVDIVQINLVGNENDNVKLTLSVDKNLPLVMLGDGLRIKQLINHLLRNAFKYTARGTVGLYFHFEPQDGDNFHFITTVQDTGKGMTPEQIESLTGDNTRYNEHGYMQGTGLGLLITRRLVGLMNGKILVSSEPNKGTTFTVKIPVTAVGSGSLGAGVAEKLQSINKDSYSFQAKPTINYEPMPYGRVLIVDDVESNLFVAKGLMEQYLLNIETVTGGLQAVEKIKNGEVYDIIFMDHMMPDMDGVEATKAILEQGYTRPIVALTANAILGQAALFHENGFAGFISKPIDTKHLDEYLIRFVHDKYPEDVRQKAREESTKRVIPKEAGLSEELTKHFVRDAKNAAKTLEDLMQITEFSPADLKRYTITTHGMKSALANVGVPELSEKAAVLENAGRENNSATISAETPPFLARLFETIAIFEEKITPVVNETLADDPAFVKQHLSTLSEACDMYNKSAAKKTLAALKSGQCSAKTLAFLDEISALLLHGEFEKIAEKARAYTV
jgi:PAS domain S-box-containing protein